MLFVHATGAFPGRYYPGILGVAFAPALFVPKTLLRSVKPLLHAAMRFRIEVPLSRLLFPRFLSAKSS